MDVLLAQAASNTFASPVTTGRIGDRTFAFVALARGDDVAVHDITDPSDVTLVQHVTDAMSGSPGQPAAPGTRSLHFTSEDESPTRQPLRVLVNAGRTRLVVYPIQFGRRSTVQPVGGRPGARAVAAMSSPGTAHHVA